jgi:hypothetical protein
VGRKGGGKEGGGEEEVWREENGREKESDEKRKMEKETEQGKKKLDTRGSLLAYLRMRGCRSKWAESEKIIENKKENKKEKKKRLDTRSSWRAYLRTRRCTSAALRIMLGLYFFFEDGYT